MCTRNILNYKAKMLLYHAAIKSHLDYCSIAYFDKLWTGQIKELYALQKQAVRLIFRARKRYHTNKLFKLSEIIPVTRQYEIESIKFVSKYQNELTCSTQPLAIRELFAKISESRTRQNSNMIKIPNEYKKGHCMYNLIDNWNSDFFCRITVCNLVFCCFVLLRVCFGFENCLLLKPVSVDLRVNRISAISGHLPRLEDRRMRRGASGTPLCACLPNEGDAQRWRLIRQTLIYLQPLQQTRQQDNNGGRKTRAYEDAQLTCSLKI